MNVSISSNKLGKTYRIGLKEDSSSTFIEAITRQIIKPIKNLKNIRQLSQNSNRTGDSYIWALNNISFDIKEGEVVGIIGPNGAGKSTLLKILSKITYPTQGTVQIKGRVSSLLEVGTGFHPELTGRENVYLNGTILGMTRKEVSNKFDEIIDFSGVETFIDTPVKRYSSGMQVRLAFAVAAHLEPEILLVDEVLAVGDAEFQKRCLGKMKDTANAGKTVIFVSHNMTSISRLCDRAILLEKGSLIKDGQSSEVISHYLHKPDSGKNLRTWETDNAPGHEGVKLLSVELESHQDSEHVWLNSTSPIKIKINYNVSKAPLKMRCAAMIFTQGVCAFSTFEPQEREHNQKGNYQAEVEIPPNLLIEGEHSINISIFGSRGYKLRYVDYKDALGFHVKDEIDGTSSRGDYTQNVMGIVHPLLNWSSMYKND
tara:strand:+ start:1991 stop:3274 length:1284 start_codon:yes stop_codon:yes gene_type:complete